MILLGCLAAWTATFAQEAPANGEAVSAPANSEDTAEDKEGWSGMTVFAVVFIFALLFVLSSATALNNLGGKKRQPPQPRSKTTPSRRKVPEGKDRFRL
jgi:hypothetical protein